MASAPVVVLVCSKDRSEGVEQGRHVQRGPCGAGMCRRLGPRAGPFLSTAGGWSIPPSQKAATAGSWLAAGLVPPGGGGTLRLKKGRERERRPSAEQPVRCGEAGAATRPCASAVGVDETKERTRNSHSVHSIM